MLECRQAGRDQSLMDEGLTSQGRGGRRRGKSVKGWNGLQIVETQVVLRRGRGGWTMEEGGALYV